jgi:large subunit ribosomal protein L21
MININKRKILFQNFQKFNYKEIKSNYINTISSTRNFSNSLTEENNPEEKSVREKVIDSLDYKKIFKKKSFYRNFKVLDTLGEFKDFEERDTTEMLQNMKRKLYASDYLKIHEDWQKNLLKNKIRKGIIKHKYENYVNILR